MTDFPAAGQWLRWVTPEFGREGEVISAMWPSFTVRWLGVDNPQTFPLGYVYFVAGSTEQMEFIDRPKNATQIRRQQASGIIGVAAAAAAMGTTPKIIRARLRAGKLKGIQRDGKWVSVILDD